MPIQMFDDGQKEFVEAVQNFGSQVGGILRDRLHKKQFEDFLAGPTKEFKDSMQQAQDILLDETNTEGPSQGMQILKGALETYMDEGARYADNPIIQQRVMATFKMNMDFLNMEFKQKFDAAKAESEKAAAKREGRYKEAQIGAQNALTAKYQAETDKIKQGDAETASAVQLFSGKPGSIDPTMEDPNRVHELWSRIENAIDRPSSESERKSVDAGMGEIRTQMAQQKLAEMAGRGEQRPASTDAAGLPTGGGNWDVYNPEHVAAVAATIDPAEVRNRFVMEKAKAEGQHHGIGPELLEKEFGVVVDPTKANAFRPLSEPVSSENLGKVLFGVGGWDTLRDPNTRARPKNLSEATERLPASISQASGPLAETMKRFTRGELPEGVDPTAIKSPEELERLLLKEGYRLITAVVGNNAPAGTLNEGMKQNRLEAKKLVDAMVDKYLDEIYANVTGKPRKVEGKTEAEAAQSFPLLGSAARTIGKVTRGVLKPAKDKVTGIIKDFQED